MKKEKLDTLREKIETHKAAIARERDGLRAAVAEAEELAECCERADMAMEEAIDALSELV